jgi:hypothetical protein
MFAELPHCSDVTLLSALGETAQLQTLDHSLSQFSHDYTSIVDKLNSLVSLDRISGLSAEV